MFEKAYVLVIGGANIDFVSLANNPLIWNDKNPGKIQTSLGGVGRNIAENLAKLNIHTKLLSLVGDDLYGKFLLEKTAENGVDVSLTKQIKNQSSSVYFSLMDADEDMVIAISDMDIMQKLTPELIAENRSSIEQAKLVVLDTNLSSETLSYLLTTFKNTTFLVDTVSVNKCKKIAPFMRYIDTLKPNRLEAEALTGIKIKTIEDAHLAIDKLLEAGIKNVFLSFGSKGLIFGNKEMKKHISPYKINVINAAGAGDSMMASIVYGIMMNSDLDRLLCFANAAAAFTLTSESTIHPKFSIESIHQFIKKQEDNNE